MCNISAVDNWRAIKFTAGPQCLLPYGILSASWRWHGTSKNHASGNLLQFDRD